MTRLRLLPAAIDAEGTISIWSVPAFARAAPFGAVLQVCGRRVHGRRRGNTEMPGLLWGGLLFLRSCFIVARLQAPPPRARQIDSPPLLRATGVHSPAHRSHRDASSSPSLRLLLFLRLRLLLRLRHGAHHAWLKTLLSRSPAALLRWTWLFLLLNIPENRILGGMASIYVPALHLPRPARHTRLHMMDRRRSCDPLLPAMVAVSPLDMEMLVAPRMVAMLSIWGSNCCGSTCVVFMKLLRCRVHLFAFDAGPLSCRGHLQYEGQYIKNNDPCPAVCTHHGTNTHHFAWSRTPLQT